MDIGVAKTLIHQMWIKKYVFLYSLPKKDSFMNHFEYEPTKM